MSDIDSFKEKLEAQYTFPVLYKFKFIVPKNNVDQVIKLFAKHDVQLRPSKKGTYQSVTASVMVESSDKIIDTYKEASKVEGIISL